MDTDINIVISDSMIVGNPYGIATFVAQILACCGLIWHDRICGALDRPYSLLRFSWLICGLNRFILWGW
jgi:hypothetical protein